MLFAGENFDEMRDGFSLITKKNDLVCISCSTQEHNYHCRLPSYDLCEHGEGKEIKIGGGFRSLTTVVGL
jgi:hypothetical protein